MGAFHFAVMGYLAKVDIKLTSQRRVILQLMQAIKINLGLCKLSRL